MVEAKEAKAYIGEVLRRASGLEAIAYERREAMPKPVEPGEIPEAFTDVAIDTSDLPDALTLMNKTWAAGAQVLLPAISHTSISLLKNFEHNNEFTGSPEHAITSLAYSIFADAALQTALLGATGYLASNGNMLWLLGSVAAKISYNIGVQVVPDAIGSSKRKMKEVVFDAKTRLAK